MITIDYEFYNNIYGGSIIPSRQIFLRISTKATMFMNKVTFNRINSENITNEIKLGICAIADEMFKIENDGGIKAVESVGNHSVSYKVDGVSEDLQYLKVAKIYIPQEYFYRGVY